MLAHSIPTHCKLVITTTAAKKIIITNQAIAYVNLQAVMVPALLANGGSGT